MILNIIKGGIIIKKIKDYFNLFFKRTKNKLKILNSHKIFFWGIIFFPVALYRIIKHKLFSKKTIIGIFILLTTLFLLILDMSVRPYALIDRFVKEEITLNKEQFGEFRKSINIGLIEDKYYIYDLITSNGNYNLYIAANEENRYIIDGIKDKNENKFIKKPSKISADQLDIKPEILIFLSDLENSETFGKPVKLIESNENIQLIKTTKGEYKFNVFYNQVIAASDSKNPNENLYSNKQVEFIPSEIKRYIRRDNNKSGDIASIINYSITANSRRFIFTMDNGSMLKIECMDDTSLVIYD